MIVITLGPERMIDPSEDDLGRDRIGYSETMSPMALYDAGHGAWHLGERAHRENFALLAFDGTGVLAIQIDRVEPVSGTVEGRESSRRSVIHGAILTTGHPIHDTYVGRPSPIPPQRNPVGYYDAPEEHAPCQCGCGGQTPAGKDFITGHDQTALHDRVRQLGTVRDFIEWFDRVRGGYWPDINVIFDPVRLADNTPTGESARLRHRLDCTHLYTDDSGRIRNNHRIATREEIASLRPCKTCIANSAKAALAR
ncbi:hypothetical protein ABZV14_32700 [Streptosporangium canum]|uniref:hypothetical protein n=1 Tax=Streptosporangium canum TaxID=324952 RepID=UPI0033A396CA